MASVVIAIALFLGGITVGVVAVVAVSVRREDRAFSIAGDAPDRISRMWSPAPFGALRLSLSVFPGLRRPSGARSPRTTPFGADGACALACDWHRSL